MKFKVNKLTECFIYLSFFYLFFLSFETSFSELIIFINTILFSYEIISLATANYYGMYRSKNRIGYCWQNIKNTFQMILIPYLVFLVVITISYYIHTDVITSLLTTTSLIIIIMMLTLLISIFNSYLISFNKQIIIILFFLSTNYLATFIAGSPKLEFFLRNISIFSWYTISWQIIKLATIILIYILLKIKVGTTKYENISN